MIGIMLNHDAIKALFEFNKDYIELKEVDGEERFHWASLDISTPIPPLFKKLNEVNKRRVLFYVPLVMKEAFNMMTMADINEVLNLHNNYGYSKNNILAVLYKLFNNHYPPLFLTHKLYKVDVIDIFNNAGRIPSSTYCNYFLLNSMLMVIYNELDDIPKDFIPTVIFKNGDTGEDEVYSVDFRDNDINEKMDIIFKGSKLPEVE